MFELNELDRSTTTAAHGLGCYSDTHSKFGLQRVSGGAVCGQKWLQSGKFRFSKVDSVAEVCLLPKAGSVVQREALSALSQLYLNQACVSRKIPGTSFTNSRWKMLRILLVPDYWMSLVISRFR